MPERKHFPNNLYGDLILSNGDLFPEDELPDYWSVAKRVPLLQLAQPSSTIWVKAVRDYFVDWLDFSDLLVHSPQPETTTASLVQAVMSRRKSSK
jgi:hypothetical protein